MASLRKPPARHWPGRLQAMLNRFDATLSRQTPDRSSSQSAWVFNSVTRLTPICDVTSWLATIIPFDRLSPGSTAFGGLGSAYFGRKFGAALLRAAEFRPIPIRALVVGNMKLRVHKFDNLLAWRTCGAVFDANAIECGQDPIRCAASGRNT